MLETVYVTTTFGASKTYTCLHKLPHIVINWTLTIFNWYGLTCIIQHFKLIIQHVPAKYSANFKKYEVLERASKISMMENKQARDKHRPDGTMRTNMHSHFIHTHTLFHVSTPLRHPPPPPWTQLQYNSGLTQLSSVVVVVQLLLLQLWFEFLFYYNSSSH